MDDKIWVEVFDCFFGNKRKQYHFDNEPEIPEAIKDIISKIQNMSSDNLSPDEMDKIFESELGTPDEVIEYEEGNLQFTKKVWNNGDGKKMVRIFATIKDGINYDELSLLEKLKIAEQNEDYEEAAKIKEVIDNQDFIDRIENN